MGLKSSVLHGRRILCARRCAELARKRSPLKAITSSRHASREAAALLGASAKFLPAAKGHAPGLLDDGDDSSTPAGAHTVEGFVVFPFAPT